MNFRHHLETSAVERRFTEAEAYASGAVVDAAIAAAGAPSARGIVFAARATDLARIAIADMDRLASAVGTLATWCLSMTCRESAGVRPRVAYVTSAHLDEPDADPETVVCLVAGPFDVPFCQAIVLEAAQTFPRARVVCLTSVGSAAGKEEARSSLKEDAGVTVTFRDIPFLLPRAMGPGADGTDPVDFIPPYVAARSLAELGPANTAG